MAGCCDPRPYGRMFDEGRARRDARDYLRKGLDANAQRVVERLAAHGLAGATVLEVGGGVGAIALDLVRRGAARATNVELSPSYEGVAAGLAAELGLADRVERMVMDFARDGEPVPEADLVVMHRVVCCYPDMPRLVSLAARKARRQLAMTFPAERLWNHLGFPLASFFLRLTRGFAVFLHPPREIVATASAEGMRASFEHRGLIWQVEVLERA